MFTIQSRLQSTPASLGREEIVVRRVTALGLRIPMRFVAAVSRWFATVRVHALNGDRIRERSLAGVTDHIEEQPRDRIRVERVNMRRSLARNFAAVFQLPCRPS